MSVKPSFAVAVLFTSLCACDSRPKFSDEEIRSAKLGTGLPAGFLLGAASSAYQTEGGQDNDWTEWEKTSFEDGRPHMRNGARSGRATGSWELWRQDVAALEQLGANTYRLSLEWSRLEPTPGAWDAAAVARYREILTELRGKGIVPFVTLHHFTLPRWVADAGGWEWAEVLPAYQRYVQKAAESFGDLVDSWVTINEPTGIAVEGYINGVWPPGVMDTKRASTVLVTLMKAHAQAAATLRQSDTQDADGDGLANQVGIAHHVQIFQPASSSPLDTMIAGLTDAWANESFPQAVRTGKVQLFIPGDVDLTETIDGLKGSFDFMGINFYERNFIRTDLSDPSLSKRFVPATRPKNDVGWDIYPEGFYRALMRYSKYGWPVFVLENGVSDANDSLRPAYLRSHLYAVQQAVKDGADVRGYIHWSLMDNFELTEGFESRFGIFAINPEDPALVRRPKCATVEVFREAARGLGRNPPTGCVP